MRGDGLSRSRSECQIERGREPPRAKFQREGVTKVELCLGLARVRVDLHLRSGSGWSLAMRTRSRPQHKPTNGHSCGVYQYFQATSHFFQKDGVSWFAKRTPHVLVREANASDYFDDFFRPWGWYG